MTTTRTSYLSINSVVLNTPAWDVRNLHVLWEGPEVRGNDRIIPFSHGVRPHRRWRTARRVTLEMWITGVRDKDGGHYPNPAVGLQTNVYYLRTNVVDPPATDEGTYTATLVLPDGTTSKTGAVHVLGFELAPISNKFALATMDISIVNGVLS